MEKALPQKLDRETLKRQGRSVMGFFEQAIQAIVNPSVPAPSLIPQI